MNGIIDQQTPSLEWRPSPPRAMLHQSLDVQTSPNAKEMIQLFGSLDLQMAEHNKEFDLAINTLRGMYMFSHNDEVTAFLKSNRAVAPLLIEAFPYMSRAFAGAAILLDLMNEEESSQTINALALWWGKREEARTALRKFDREWWLDNIGKANGRIVFDYQIER
jgi:hypothetical protein